MKERVKTYVKVVLEVDPDGNITPKSIQLHEDGPTFEVTGVIGRPVQAAAMKAGGIGMRYEVLIGRKQTYLWDEDGRWFVEEKVG